MSGTVADSKFGGTSSSAGKRPSTDREERLAAVIEEYLAALETGCACSPDELIAAHPDIARELRTCLEGLQAVEGAAGSLGRNDSRMQELARAKRLGDFEIVRELGRGGMGIVYEAMQLSLGRRVALKMLPFAGLFDRSRIARFQAEAKAAAQLHHPHIVPVHSVGRERGVQYYSMQYIEGHGLDAVIRELREGPTIKGNGTSTRSPLETVSPGATAGHREYYHAIARLGMQAAEALAHAHSCGITHRDVKPSNLLLDEKGKLWLSDFGLAKLEDAGSLTLSGDLLGTLRYMSPEQALGSTDVDGTRLDVYSLGATLYELIALAPAFSGKDRQAILRAISLEEPTPLRKIRSDTPRELETIVSKAMEKEPTRRYANAAALAADLERFVENRPIEACRPTLLERARKWSRRHHGAAAVASFVLLISLFGLSVGTLLVKRSYQRASDELYLSIVRLAMEDWETGNFTRFTDLLERHRPEPGEIDRRGWEWYYLESLRHKDLHTVEVGGGSTRSVAWSPDGELVATGSADGAVRVWRWSIEETDTVTSWKTSGGEVVALAWNPTGESLVTATADRAIRVWDARSGELATTFLGFDEEQDVFACAWSPDGQKIAASGQQGTLRVWSVSTQELLKSVDLPGRRSPIRDCAWSPSGNYLAAVCNVPGWLLVYKTDTWEEVFRSDSREWNVHTVAFSPDETFVATGDGGGLIRVWNVSDWSLHASIESELGSVLSIDWSPHRRQLACGGEAKMVRVLDVETLQEVRTLRGHSRRVFGVAWQPQGDILASCSQDGTLKFWDPTVEQRCSVLPGQHPAAWSPDGRWLAMAANQRGDLVVADADTGETVRRLSMDGDSSRSLLTLSFSLDSRYVAVRKGDLFQVWNWRQNVVVGAIKADGEHRVKGAAWGPENRLALGIRDYGAQIWDVEQWLSAREFPWTEHEVGALTWSPDGTYLASMTNADSSIRVRLASTGEEVHHFRHSEARHSPIRHHALAWSPDSRRLASGSQEGELLWWDVTTGDELLRVDGHAGAVRSVAWSPDGRRLATGGGDRQVKIWDVQTGKQLLTLRGHRNKIWSLSWHPDGTRLLSADPDENSVRIWEAESARDEEQ